MQICLSTRLERLSHYGAVVYLCRMLPKCLFDTMAAYALSRSLSAAKLGVNHNQEVHLQLGVIS